MSEFGSSTHRNDRQCSHSEVVSLQAADNLNSHQLLSFSAVVSQQKDDYGNSQKSLGFIKNKVELLFFYNVIKF